ncbi:MAG: NAD-dependent epimerase/dehydratase family protein [Fibrobacter sp.]|nr:NAD-dependent epimerase/dehydratase family protein [Fibrobacter sp.]
MKIIVTGATGFVGSNLVRRLITNGNSVFVIVRSTSKIMILEDIIDKISIFAYDGNINKLIEYFTQVKPDIVFHIASLALPQHQPKDIRPLIESNLIFGTEIVEAMINSGCYKLINTGTSWQHYNNEEYNPVCLYAATKEAFEKILKYYLETTSLQLITLKLFDTYGENDSRPKIANLLHSNANRETVLDMSPGEQEIDIVHISDVVDSYLIAMDLILSSNIKSKTYGISSGNPISLKHFVECYNKTHQPPVRVNWGGRPYRSREVMKTWKAFESLPGFVCKKVVFRD